MKKTAKEMYHTSLPDVGKLLKAGARVCRPGALCFCYWALKIIKSANQRSKCSILRIIAEQNNKKDMLQIITV
jgi:hypothetical protein